MILLDWRHGAGTRDGGIQITTIHVLSHGMLILYLYRYHILPLPSSCIS